MSLEDMLGVKPGETLLQDAATNNPANDTPRPQPMDLLSQIFAQSFKQFDARKRFDPFYLDSDTNADGPFGVPTNDAQLSDVFSRYTQDQQVTGMGSGAPAGADTAAPPGSNPFDIGGAQAGGGPALQQDSQSASSGVDPYGPDLREALRKIIRGA